MSAIAMVVLTGMLGLALDGGRGYWERRLAQNAADHAALAAAWAFCNGQTPSIAANTAAADNGFTHNGTSVWVELTGSNGTYQVIVRSKLQTTFASVLGFQSISAAGKAKARCESTTGEGFAIFAGGTHCGSDSAKLGIEIAGSDNVITGKVHTNFNVDIDGDNNTFDGPFTHVGTEQHHSNTDFQPIGDPSTDDYPQQVSDPLGWPVSFEITHYEGVASGGGPNRFYIDSSINAGLLTGQYIKDHGPGLYYATASIDADLSNVGTAANPLEVTLVSPGKIKISGSNMFLAPYEDDNLLAFSDLDFPTVDHVKRCTEPGVQMSGGNNDWRGFIYAPTSQADLNGSDNSTLNGSIIAWAVKISGSSVANTAEVNEDPGPLVLELLE